MEYNDVINAAYSRSRVGGLFSFRRAGKNYADTKTTIRLLIKVAEKHDDDVKVTWTQFTGRYGHQVEKCVIEWTLYGRRQTDVFWIKRGYRWIGA